MANMDYEPARKPFYSEAESAWIVTRYEDVLRVMRGPNVTVPAGPLALVTRVSERLGGSLEDLASLVGGLPLLLNPPTHGPSREFEHKFVRAMSKAFPQERIDAAASLLLDEMETDSDFDGMPTLCYGLQEMFLAESLGFSRAEVRELNVTGRQVTEGWRPTMPLREYQRRQTLAVDLRRRLAQQWESVGCPVLGDGHRAEVEEALPAKQREAAIFLLLTLGDDALAGYLGNVLHLLASRPDLQERLRTDPQRVFGFVEEGLRFCGSIRKRARTIPPEGLQLRDVALPGDAVVHVFLESANRDPEVYADPEVFDLDRRGPPPLAFGAGPHLCVGAVFARSQARRFLTLLLDRFSIEHGAEPARLIDQSDIRQFETLPLRLRPLQRSDS